MVDGGSVPPASLPGSRIADVYPEDRLQIT